jgi:hypothetical protein
MVKKVFSLSLSEVWSTRAQGVLELEQQRSTRTQVEGVLGLEHMVY